MARQKRKGQPFGASSSFTIMIISLIWGYTIISGAFLSFLVWQAYLFCEGEKNNSELIIIPFPALAEANEHRPPLKRAAIIIDDLGRDKQIVRRFLGLGLPLTYSILPYQPYSLEIARMVSSQGREVLLHLPMEPRDYPEVNPGTGCLLLSMPQEKIQAELIAQIKSVPYCAGVNNHMGSLFTESEEPVTWVFSVLKERNLFFVDSLTTSHSVAPKVAENIGIPYSQRTHFLDIEIDEDVIIQQLCRLADHAARYGMAVGIGHPFEETLSALPKARQAFVQKGVRLVTISEMLSMQYVPGELVRKGPYTIP